MLIRKFLPRKSCFFIIYLG